VTKSLNGIYKGKLSHAATIIYRRAVNGSHLAVAFFDPRQLPNPAAWLREKQGELAERLHYLWQPHEIPPMAGAGKAKINENLVWVLVRETLDQLFDRAARHPWRKLPESSVFRSSCASRVILRRRRRRTSARAGNWPG
jgi:hypothetical protein